MELSSNIHEAVRAYLALFYTFVAVFYTLRIFYLKQKISPEMVFMGVRFSPTWWNHFVFRCFRIVIWGVCVLRWYNPSTDAYLGLIGPMQVDAIILIGAAMMTAGFVLAFAAHFSLREDWRSGIDPNASGQLKVTGLFAMSRNPAFLGVLMAQIGFFLALPSLLSAVCMVVGMTMIYRQTLAEESHLEATFADQYTEYKRDVRRWI